MKRLVPIACCAVLALGALAGCGSDDGDDSDSNASGGSSGGGDYCSQVEDMKGSFEEISGPEASIDDFSSAADSVSGAAGAAPDDVSDSWESLDSALGDVVSKLQDTGLPTDQPLSEAVKKDKAAGKKLMSAMSGMQNLQSDADAIEKNVKDECDIELSSSSEEE